jgi:hypothetical protein
MRVLFALGWVSSLALVSVAAGQESPGTAPDFSQTRLREGEEAYAARRTVEAVDQLRIASFGFLDRPALLCESLVYLALAEEAAEHHNEARQVVDRLVDIERRFADCAEAKIDKTVREEFASRFHLRLPTSMATPKSPTPRPPASAPTPRPAG